VEVYLYFGERFALGLGHEQTTEQSAGQASDRVDDKVGGRAESVGHRLISGDHESGRDRDGHHDGRVGQGPGVGREVLALDDGQQGHESDVDEELGAGYGQEQWQPAAANDVPIPEDDGHGRVTSGRAEARDDHQRPPTGPVHDQRERHGGQQYD